MNESKQEDSISTRSLAWRLLAFAVGMFGFGFLLVPIYNVFCEVTGLGGKTNTEAATDFVVSADESREIELQFVTTVNQYAPWEFHAEVDSMPLHPGSIY